MSGVAPFFYYTLHYCKMSVFRNLLLACSDYTLGHMAEGIAHSPAYFGVNESEKSISRFEQFQNLLQKED